MIITQFDAATFLAQYWQKKPCVIKQFASDFIDPIDENDLAGLAQEEEVDSRIVSFYKEQWRVATGPFDDFNEHCVGSWTLLAQGVDKYIDEVNHLTQLVDFLPYWRLDDVMVSFSNKGAGVGPHTDEYDVFIIQGKGTRRWQVGLPNDAKIKMPHALLKQIEGFDPVIDEVLAPGDAVYIPPKHPHNGVALDDCLNYSIGFRAPTNIEVLQGIVDESEGFLGLEERYGDASVLDWRTLNDKPEHVSATELHRLRQSVIELISNPQGNSALLKYLSIQQLPQVDSAEYTPNDVLIALQDGLSLIKMPGVRAIYTDSNTNKFDFYIDGNKFSVPASIASIVQSFIAQEYFSISDIPTSLFKDDEIAQAEFVQSITAMLNKGYWIIDNDQE